MGHNTPESLPFLAILLLPSLSNPIQEERRNTQLNSEDNRRILRWEPVDRRSDRGNRTFHTDQRSRVQKHGEWGTKYTGGSENTKLRRSVGDSGLGGNLEMEADIQQQWSSQVLGAGGQESLEARALLRLDKSPLETQLRDLR